MQVSVLQGSVMRGSVIRGSVMRGSVMRGVSDRGGVSDAGVGTSEMPYNILRRGRFLEDALPFIFCMFACG